MPDVLCVLALLAPLYTRIGADHALEHETRQRLVTRLRDCPGSTRRELAAALGVPLPTLMHHIDMLRALGLVHARREGREVVYAVGAAPVVPRALQAPPRARLAQLLAQAPRTQNELATLTGSSQRLIAYHLRRMAPFVQDDGGRPRRYRLRPGSAPPSRS